MNVKIKKLANVSAQCVACGCCEKVCPTGAVKVYGGVRAVVNPDLCVGCGLCSKSCPASVISLVEKEPTT